MNIKKLMILGLTLTLGLSTLAGCSSKKDEEKGEYTTQQIIDEGGLEAEDNDKDKEGSEQVEQKPQQKVAVNISGTVEEVNEDGSKIKVDGKWIIITEETVFGDDPDNGVEAVSKEFEVGNRVAGFTQDDTSKDEVTAYAIYKNAEQE